MTSSFYGVFAYFVAAFAWPVILFVFDFLNFVFTFAAATAIAAGIRAHSCSNQDYLDDNNIAQGSSGRCRKAQASTAFLYFSTFIFIASAIFSAISLPKVVYSVTLPDQLKNWCPNHVPSLRFGLKMIIFPHQN